MLEARHLLPSAVLSWLRLSWNRIRLRLPYKSFWTICGTLVVSAASHHTSSPSYRPSTMPMLPPIPMSLLGPQRTGFRGDMLDVPADIRTAAVQELVLVTLVVVLYGSTYDQGQVIASIRDTQLESGKYIKKVRTKDPTLLRKSSLTWNSGPGMLSISFSTTCCPK